MLIRSSSAASPMSFNSTCDVSESFWVHKDNAYFFSYYIVSPTYFLLGVVGHAVCLLVFYRQAKKESTYAYQIFVAVSEIFEMIAFTLFSLSFRWWSGIEAEGRGAEWFMRSRWLMLYAAHVSFPFLNAVLTTTLLLSLCMSADRLVALWKPFLYKRMDHRKYQRLALISSIVLGMSTSIFDGFRFRVVPYQRSTNDSKSPVIYRAVGELEYMNSLQAVCLAHTRDALRIAALMALITCNVFITRFYRKRTVRLGSLTSTDDDRLQHRRNKERTLVLLTVSQSVLTSVGTTFLILFYAIVYANPNFLTCGGLLMAPILDATLQLASIIDTFIVIAIDRRFRRMVSKVLPRFLRRSLFRDAASGKSAVFLMVRSPSGFSKSSAMTTSALASKDCSAAASRRGSVMPA